MENIELGKVEPKITTKRTRATEKDMLQSEAPAFRSSFFSGYNDFQVYVRTWDKVENPKAIVLILHGMVEHGLRYDEFAKFLNTKGFIAVVPDERGHGKTAGAPENVGKYDGDIFADTVRDDIKLADTLIQKYKLPLFVLGHSYGSFRTQSFIQNYHQHAGAIIVGSACYRHSMIVAMGKMVADITKLFKGKNAPAKMIAKMSFDSYGKHFEKQNWLTSDEEIYNAYCRDPYCGAIASAQFYSSFFGNLKKLYKPALLNQIDKDKPILITSGEKDYVGGKNHKDIDKLAPLYRSYGIKDVEYKLWANGRHELLNETFRKEVFEYIAEWITVVLLSQNDK